MRPIDHLRGNPHFCKPGFSLEKLESLGQVDVGDLVEFLRDKQNTSCPEELISVMPELIYRQTGGWFDSTVALIEEAEITTWQELYHRLHGHKVEPPGEPKLEDVVF